MPHARLHEGIAGALVLSVVSVFGLGGSSAADAASTFVVNTAGDPGPPGTTSLRQAIAAANASAGNTIEFDASLMDSTITLTNGEIAFNNPMTINGLGRTHLTISGNGASRVFDISYCLNTQDTFLKNLTITGGNSPYIGGAIVVLGACRLTVAYAAVTSSHSSTDGGAIYVGSGSTVELLGSTISGNSAFTGGGLASVGALFLQQSSIRANTASYLGGGIAQLGGYLGVFYSTVSGNSIPPPGSGGYGQGGGGIYARQATLRSGASTIADNYAYAGGAGIAFGDADTANGSRITTSTIAGNSSCCFEGGNGIKDVGGLLYLDSDIVAGNFNRGGVYDLSGAFDIDYSLVTNVGNATVSGTGAIFGIDPKLSRLADWGGPTWTMLPAADSPVIAAVAHCSSLFPYDQRQFIHCAGGHSDMGAVQRQSPEVVIFRNGFDP